MTKKELKNLGFEYAPKLGASNRYHWFEQGIYVHLPLGCSMRFVLEKVFEAGRFVGIDEGKRQKVIEIKRTLDL